MSTLYLVRLPISLPALGRWAAIRNFGWSVRRDSKGREQDSVLDEGRALHHLLSETFGKQVIHPFRLFAAPRGMRGQIYAYSQADAAALCEIAGACALPEVTEVCDLGRLAVKAMPEVWRSGKRLGFETRVRPISRLIKELPCVGGSVAKGAELDSFLLEAMRRFPADSSSEASMLKSGRSREAVYTDWLTRQLVGAATLAPGVRLTRFVRNRAARKGSSIEGPDAILQGDLVIDDPESFREMLIHGIGRHKAYGYGMLLLRPPRPL